jgi:hypothetical protein
MRSGRGCHDGQTKVCELDATVLCQQQVLGLKISVNYIVAMTNLHRKKNVPHALAASPKVTRSTDRLATHSVARFLRGGDDGWPNSPRINLTEVIFVYDCIKQLSSG